MSVQQMVTEFHLAMGQPVRDLAHPDEDQGADRIQLRLSLIDEEAGEVADSVLSWTPCDICGDHEVARITDLPHLAKELADLVYVVYGWAVELGVDLDAVIREVHRSNMSKLVDGHPVLDERGKVLKGKNFSPADIGRVLAEQVRAHG